LYELPSARALRRLGPGPIPIHFAFRPDGRQLALAYRDYAQVRDVETGDVGAPFSYPPERWTYVAWSPDGKTLVTVGGDWVIRLWDVATRKQTVQLEGFKNNGINFAFNRAGDLLASTAWDATLRLWDPRTGQQLFQVRVNTHGIEPRFGPDDRLLAAGANYYKPSLWEVAPSRTYSTLVCDPVLGKSGYVTSAVHPKGRLLAAGMANGLGFWDCRTGAALDFVPLQGVWVWHVGFDTSGALLTEGLGGPYRWPVRPDPAAPEQLRIGPPQRLPLPGTLRASSPDGRVIVSSQEGGEGAVVWHADRPGKLVPLTRHYDARNVSISPDGRWVATGSVWGTGAKVWDVAGGQCVKDLVPTQNSVGVCFSPDGKWLATAAGGVCRLWAVDSWQEGPSLGACNWGGVAFSPDGKLVAVETGQNTVRLLDPDTGREYARLEDPNQDRAWPLAFSPDGTQLVAIAERQSLHVWDLRAIREELAQRHLDWGLPAYPPPTVPPDAPPLRVVVDLGVPGGDALVGQREWKKAIAAYTVTIEGNSEDAVAHNNLAWLLATCPDVKFRDPARAVELAKKAAALAPQEGNFWNTLGTAHYRAENWKDAVESLEKSMEFRNGGDGFDWFFLAMAHWQLGDKEMARSWHGWAAEWMDKNARENEELRRFRREAEELLEIKKK
jgi:WD40 repeat protein